MGYSIETIIRTLDQIDGRVVRATVKINTKSLDQALTKFNKLESKVKNFSTLLNAVNNGNGGKGNKNNNKDSSKDIQKNLDKQTKYYNKLISEREALNKAINGTLDKQAGNKPFLNTGNINKQIAEMRSARNKITAELTAYDKAMKSGAAFKPAHNDSFFDTTKRMRSELKDMSETARAAQIVPEINDKKLSNFDKLGNRLTSYYEQHRGKIEQDQKLFDKYNTLMRNLQTGTYASTKDANTAFANFRMQCRKAGVEVQSFGGLLKNTFGSRVRSALAGQGVYMIQTALREIFQSSLQVDTAMTELKKVTDLTASGYNDFLEGAQERAKKLGATLTEVINATADYARLGYSVPQATLLADSALIYQNVGDDVENIDDATSALISTMQGFGIAAEDSMSIVDKFNNVSNNYASSAGDIGEMVKRSAAAMSAAGNSLEQTIALGVGANEVQQDA